MDEISCPFCGATGIPAIPGKTFCPGCRYHFLIDDRAECVFANPLDLRLPLSGTVCPLCGLIQGDDAKYCFYCNRKLNSINALS